MARPERFRREWLDLCMQDSTLADKNIVLDVLKEINGEITQHDMNVRAAKTRALIKQRIQDALYRMPVPIQNMNTDAAVTRINNLLRAYRVCLHSQGGTHLMPGHLWRPPTSPMSAPPGPDPPAGIALASQALPLRPPGPSQGAHIIETIAGIGPPESRSVLNAAPGPVASGEISPPDGFQPGTPGPLLGERSILQASDPKSPVLLAIDEALIRSGLLGVFQLESTSQQPEAGPLIGSPILGVLVPGGDETSGLFVTPDREEMFAPPGSKLFGTIQPPPNYRPTSGPIEGGQIMESFSINLETISNPQSVNPDVLEARMLQQRPEHKWGHLSPFWSEALKSLKLENAQGLIDFWVEEQERRLARFVVHTTRIRNHIVNNPDTHDAMMALGLQNERFEIVAGWRTWLTDAKTWSDWIEHLHDNLPSRDAWGLLCEWNENGFDFSSPLTVFNIPMDIMLSDSTHPLQLSPNHMWLNTAYLSIEKLQECLHAQGHFQPGQTLWWSPGILASNYLLFIDGQTRLDDSNAFVMAVSRSLSGPWASFAGSRPKVGRHGPFDESVPPRVTIIVRDY
ncbi:unnamed protein product [Penicillium pancosmium]